MVYSRQFHLYRKEGRKGKARQGTCSGNLPEPLQIQVPFWGRRIRAYPMVRDSDHL